MTDYENRQPAEGINVTAEHPLRLFLRLALGATVLVVSLVWALRWFGGVAAQRVPFEFERRTVEKVVVENGFEFGDPDASPRLQAYLDDLAARLQATMPVPDGMTIDVHYDPDPTFNAFATVGGHLVLHGGLLARLPHENALAMVMAHEIAHVLHRDPVAALGGGVASALALAAVSGSAGSAAALLNRAGLVTGLRFTRSMERAADAAAVTALGRLYGHVNGAAALFETIARARGGADDGTPRWLERFAGTHPLDADRVASIGRRARAAGVPEEGGITPLPDGYATWLAR